MSARLNVCLLLAGVLSAPLTFAGITTPKVIASAACPDCLDYQVIGTCLWMTCTPIGCTTKTSIKVKHRLPDFVVMSYPETGNAPWKATQWMSPDNRFAKNGGHATGRSVQGLDNPSLRFYNTDVIGHPGGKTVYSLLAGMGYSLDSKAKPFMPHYLSSLDPLGWRYNLPDALSIDGLNPFGETLGNFGDVYPRGGFVLQPHPYKAAALTAFRALHLVTRKGQSRVYNPFVLTRHAGYWPPGPVKPNNKETAFQMLYPDTEHEAHVWPRYDDSLSAFDPYSNQIATNDQYVWAVWRLYKGCQRRGAKLIAHFGD
ncbi:TIGR03756 family integrating conjugative element protein [Vibrio parahaemolyticus]|uniref:TIGR03756 family integrating conjugative element protein n=1 Tax=Vibrio parahaemolyticus TaxID=670 RepID=UPI00111FB780|nr:TIGR03756 family integrating conjugative element protein [Vibrio parahaemolyticus]TOG95097.1 integrating conjugative element protein [Vibrio parahaemolyticus]